MYHVIVSGAPNGTGYRNLPFSKSCLPDPHPVFMKSMTACEILVILDDMFTGESYALTLVRKTALELYAQELKQCAYHFQYNNVFEW